MYQALSSTFDPGKPKNTMSSPAKPSHAVETQHEILTFTSMANVIELQTTEAINRLLN